MPLPYTVTDLPVWPGMRTRTPRRAPFKKQWNGPMTNGREMEAIVAEARDLETVLADARQRAQVLRAEGHPIQAAAIERVCDEVKQTTVSYLTWLSDKEAILRSGWSLARLRNKFGEWKALGFARYDERDNRQYRESIVPPRIDGSEDRLAGERGESLNPRKRASGA